MHQVPHDIWKEIDQQIGLRSPLAKKIVQAEDIEEALDDLYMELEKAFEHNALSALFSFGFLYLENEAISKYIEKNSDHGLRKALPEILSQHEIWSLVEMERMISLNNQEKQQLELLLYRALGTLEEII